MVRFVAGRAVQACAALLLLSVLAFGTSRATGSPLDLLLPLTATAEDYARMSEALGLDQPILVQYGIFLRGAAQGDLGRSIRSGQPVTSLLAERLGASTTLALTALLMSFLVGVPLGVVSAVRRGTPVDTFVKFVALLGQSAPPFWVGILSIELFAVVLGWLPPGASGKPLDVVLPAATLSLFGVASVARLLRSSMIEILDAEFVKLLRAKGLPEWSVVWQHALKNALLPVVSFGGVFFVNLITLAVVVETVFTWPGIGHLSYSSILARDYPVVQGVVLLAATVSILVNTGVDVLYVYIDPRIGRGNS